MSITYTYNSKGYYEIKAKGLISDKDIMEARINFFSESSWIPELPELIDLSEADFGDVTPDGLKQIISFSERMYIYYKVTNIKQAFYTTDMVPSALLSLFSDTPEDISQEIKVFSDKTDAEEWLVKDLLLQEYLIDLDKGIIYLKYSGMIIADLLIEQLFKMRRDPDFHNGLNTIADLRGVTYPDATRNMIKMAEFTHASVAQRGDFKLAQIINPDDKDYVELYKELTMKGHVKLCYSMSEAEEWLCKE